MENSMIVSKIDKTNSVIIDIETKEVLTDSMPHAEAFAKFARIKTMTHLVNVTFN